MRDIGKNIKSLRIERNMTQDELAQLLFVTRQTVSSYETGNSHPDVDMLLKIAEVFGVEVNAVIYGSQIDQKQRRRRWHTGILIGGTVALGVLLAVVADAVSSYNQWFSNKYYMHFYSAALICRNWLKPAWLLMVGWVFMHGLCEFYGTRTLKSPTSHYVKWGVVAFIAAYAILILPHSIWFVVEDIKSLQRHKTGFVGEYTSSFSVFPAWDQLAFLVMNMTRPRNLIQTVLAVLDYLPLPLGALLRLCRNPQKQKVVERTEV